MDTNQMYGYQQNDMISNKYVIHKMMELVIN